MSTPETNRGSDKYSWIANELRGQIASGKFAPGSQLPQRDELEETFNVSKVTLQRAMNLLIEDGFVDATRRKGSFVVPNPPHLYRYALAFQKKPTGDESWLRFWTALSNEASKLEKSHPCRFFTFYGIDGHTDTEDYHDLEREVREHRLAGVIYVATQSEVPDIPVLRESNLPRMTVKSKPQPGWPALTIHTDTLICKALDYVVARGRKRVAFITPPHIAQVRHDFILQEIAARHLTSHIYWLQGIGLEAPALARNCVHLMMHPGQNERPDALVITDDNLVESATGGLVAAGVRVPQEMDVVAHANFPWLTPSIVPAKRLGYDVSAIIKLCRECIDRQRRGESVPAVTEITPLFEDEIGSYP
ncbi:MAG: GntR family transcriptional regulator [Abitibacteriaceae bacterium]|nr:GntR family transcriptional regulator [Abditibacteriaceae bacterium]MBV9868311.1 GntR family transcriptional regulator [Abditibacteriaceae bacterium]